MFCYIIACQSLINYQKDIVSLSISIIAIAQMRKMRFNRLIEERRDVEMEYIDLRNPVNYQNLQQISFQSIQVDQLRVCIHGLCYDEGNHKKTFPHMHSFYELYYLMGGRVATTINGVTREYHEGMYYLIPPFATHSHENKRPPYRHIAFVLRWSMEEVAQEPVNTELAQMFRDIMKAGAMPMFDTENEIANTFREMVSFSRQPSAQTEIKLLFVRLLRALGNQYARMGSNQELDDLPEGAGKEIINAAVNYIHANCMADIGVNDIARHAHVSYSHLARLFSRYTKQTLKNYITNVRIDRAQHLLLTTNESINELTYMLGFASVSHFSHAFKRITGISPKLFRNIYGETAPRDSDPTIM